MANLSHGNRTLERRAHPIDNQRERKTNDTDEVDDVDESDSEHNVDYPTLAALGNNTKQPTTDTTTDTTKNTTKDITNLSCQRWD